MELIEAFAARRAERLVTADAEIREFVELALAGGPWDEVVEMASVLWLETFEESAPDANSKATLASFQRDLLKSLRKTGAGGEEPNPAQVERVTRYVGTATVNDATYQGHRAGGGLRMRWVAMRDSDVRRTHQAANGQIRSVVGTFKVGGAELRYPGDPRGPVEEIINCRCLIAGVGRVKRGSSMSVQMEFTPRERALRVMRLRALLTSDPEERAQLERHLTAAAVAAEMPAVILEEDEPVDNPVESVENDGEDFEPTIDDEIDEIPVHGIAAPEGIPTGDGRMFGVGSLTNRPLPLPIRYEIVGTHGGTTSEVVTVGRIDEMWKDDANMLRYRGVLMVNRKYTDEVIQGIVDGTARGISVEIDDVAIDMALTQEPDYESGRLPVTVIAEARVAGFTIVPIPAYIEAYIALGPEFPDELSEESREALAAAGCIECEAELEEEGDEPFTTAMVALLPEESDPVNAASSEAAPHLTTIWLGEIDSFGATPAEREAKVDLILRQIAEYSVKATPITVPVERRGTLGDDKADVAFLEPTEALLAFRDGLLFDAIAEAHDAAEQFPEWTPHVTLGYPEEPARAEYTGETVTFDRISLWFGDEQYELPLGMPEMDPALRTWRDLAPDEEWPDEMRTVENLMEMLESMGIEAITASAVALATFADAPGLKKDGTPPKCAYGDEPATQYVLHSEGMAFVPACDEHIEQAKADAAATTPDGEPDEGNIDRVSRYEAFAPGTKDGPGWITHPVPTSRIRRYWVSGKGAAKIKWGAPGDFNRCRRQLAKYVKNPDWLAGLCANMHKEALGIWPAQHHSAQTDSSAMFSLVAAANPAVPHSYFEEPRGDHPVGVVIEGDHVYGYIATWGVCHIGIPDVCTVAPHSPTNYAYFRTGVVDTDAGPVQVGQITMGTGHADARAGLRAAAEHYDNTGAAVADVAVGENSRGIWFSGLLRSSATDEQRRNLAATGRLSGDWRRMNNALEMVGALAVNVPGFPIPAVSLAASAAGQESLVAAGILDDNAPAPAELSADAVAGIARAAVQEFVHLQNRKAIQTRIREDINTRVAASVRGRLVERG